MVNLQKDFYDICLKVAKKDLSRLISHLQRKGFWYGYDYKNKYPLRIDQVMDHIKSYNITDKDTLEILIYELINISKSFDDIDPKAKSLNYHRLKLEKLIKDYNLKIEELKNRTTNYKKTLWNMDPDQEIRKFEAYTAEWANIQQKIEDLRAQKKKIERKLYPPQKVRSF